jgi:hypothetical protein
LQAWHWPSHAELQQDPSTQKPLVHWLAVVHAFPFSSVARHAPLLQ